MAVGINVLFGFLRYVFQEDDLERGRISPRGSIISNTKQKFLHWQDFHTQTWGDGLGLSIVMVVFVHLVKAKPGVVTVHQAILAGLIGAAIALFFVAFCLHDNHKPDWGYPVKGEISRGGIAHFVYFWVMSGVSIICVYHLCKGNLKCPRGEVDWLGWLVLGGVIWLASAVADWRSGKLKLVKYIIDDCAAE